MARWRRRRTIRVLAIGDGAQLLTPIRRTLAADGFDVATASTVVLDGAGAERPHGVVRSFLAYTDTPGSSAASLP